MAEENRTRSKMIRLGRILRLFMEKEKITVAWLAGYFRTTPRTIQRDLLLLKEGYHIVEVQPVDMFPHTFHIESVAKLERRIL